MPKVQRKRNRAMSKSDQRWYLQPIAWLGIAIFVGSLAGCIHLIMLAMANQDPPLVVADKDASFRIPATRKPVQAPDVPPISP